MESKLGALDFARPLENWRLPDCFALLRRRLEGELELDRHTHRCHILECNGDSYRLAEAKRRRTRAGP